MDLHTEKAAYEAEDEASSEAGLVLGRPTDREEFRRPVNNQALHTLA